MPGGSFVRVALVVLLALALAACGGRKTRPGSVPQPLGEGAPARVTPLAAGEDPCAVVLQHDERWYTPGGLYAPHIRDGRPSVQLDVANLPEPVPQLEPLSRYGNRSPYTVLGKSYTVMDERARSRYRERGIASWYGTKFHGRQTSSLEPYDMCQFSAAHKSLPLPSYALVTNLENGKDVIVRVNDRGPFHEGRVIDLSYAAALRIGVYARGTAQVEVQAIDPNDRRWQRFLAARGVGAPAASPRRAPAAAPSAATPPVQAPPTAVAAAPALPPPA
ncbi:septal ring lytic transglycosylase RlpA family protein, partial [Coralloluteibacterium thermophilus]